MAACTLISLMFARGIEGKRELNEDSGFSLLIFFFFSLGVTVKQIQCHCRCGQTDCHLALLDFGVAKCSVGLSPTLGSILELWPSETSTYFVVKQLRCGPTIWSDSPDPPVSSLAGTNSSKLCSLLQSNYSHITSLTSQNLPACKKRKAEMPGTCVSVIGVLSSWRLSPAWCSPCCTAGVFVTHSNSMKFSKPRWAFWTPVWQRKGISQVMIHQSLGVTFAMVCSGSAGEEVSAELSGEARFH